MPYHSFIHVSYRIVGKGIYFQNRTERKQKPKEKGIKKKLKVCVRFA